MKNYENVIGRNSVKEALKSGRNINKILISDNVHLDKIEQEAREKGIVIQKTNRHKLDKMTGGSNHQGIVAMCSPIEFVSVEDIVDYANEKGEKPFIIVLDNLTDPRNVGAIVRSAYCAGAHGVIFSKRRSASVGEGMYKSSAGAIEYMNLAQVSNISQAIDKLKKLGVFIVGLDKAGESYHTIDYDMPLALVVGAEGKGLSKLVHDKCDFISTIYFKNQFDSLNASAACSIAAFEVLKQRSEK